MPPPGTITRRNALGTAAAVAAVGALPKTASALDLTNPANKLEVYTRMRGGTADGELVLWWWNGNVWGKMNEDVAVVLMQVEGLTFQRLTRNADGTYLQISAGRGTFRHADTGAPLQSWTNPINGVVAEPDHIVSLNSGTVTANDIQREPSERLLVYEGGITTPVVNGGQIFLQENFVTKVKGREPGTVGTSTSLTVFTADAAAIADDTASLRPCTMNYQSLGGFRPWMGLDNAKGMISWQVFGQKLRNNAATAPADIKGWVENTYPGFLEDPGI